MKTEVSAFCENFLCIGLKRTGDRGMTFGNLFMAALSDILGSQEEAIRQTGKVLRIQGTVIPVSLTDTKFICSL